MQRWLFTVTSAVIFILATIPAAVGAEPDALNQPRGVYIELTESFYRALAQESESGTKTLGTRSGEDYLRQIAVSSRYMVETNLQLMRQQERMIRLLEELRDRPRKP